MFQSWTALHVFTCRRSPVKQNPSEHRMEGGQGAPKAPDIGERGQEILGRDRGQMSMIGAIARRTIRAETDIPAEGPGSRRDATRATAAA